MKFAIIGAAGYIAPRHMQAITENGGTIVAACDTSDSVGILDRYAPDCAFTQNSVEFFKDYLGDVDIVSVCSPNHYHVSHTRRALGAGCDVVLEKPLAVCGAEADALVAAAHDSGNKVYPVIQLRYHDEIQTLREQFLHAPLSVTADCEIDYSTYRGPWYDKSWKGKPAHSGGLLVNLGVHLFDLCMFVFGPFIHVVNAEIGQHEARGVFRCQKAIIRWRLSSREREPRRVFKIAGQNIDLSNQLLTLHKQVYSEVMRGRGFDLDDAAQALRVIDRVKEWGATQT